MIGNKILVTGGAGFIGTNLCQDLIMEGCEVTCFDNFSTGFFNNIKSLLNHKNFKLIEGDIRDLNECNKACKNIDFVLHNAALGSVPRSISDPINSTENNINGFLNMLIASRDNKVKKLIYAASSSTYGDSEQIPKIENKIGNPLSTYAITKYVNELYACVFKKNYNFNTIGLRYFNVFGPHQDPNGSYAAVIPKFIKIMINKKAPVINGDGSISRDFTFVKNVINMNKYAILHNSNKINNQIYNVACGEAHTLNDLFTLIKSYLIKKGFDIESLNPIYGNSRKGDIPHSLASIKKSYKAFNYKPEVKFKKGLEKTIDWYLESE
tara:strand:- start:51 stop:1022 length:972 start_codon:yes stop_codon:yes gene_type:complete